MLVLGIHRQTATVKISRSRIVTSHSKVWLFLFASIFLIFGFSKTYAQQTLLDYQVKAAMLYKFLGYSSWPDNRFSDSHSPYRICVLGADDIRNELQDIVADRVINNRSIEIHSAASIDQIVDAHIVFVSSRMEKLLPKLSALAEKNSFLIVTENTHGLVPGSIINFRMVDKRIGFDISLVTAQDYGISLSSRLLSVAISIKERRY